MDTSITVEVDFRGQSKGFVLFKSHYLRGGSSRDELTVAEAFEELVLTFAPFESPDPWDWIITVDGTRVAARDWDQKYLKDVKRISIIGVGEDSNTEPAHVIAERNRKRRLQKRQQEQEEEEVEDNDGESQLKRVTLKREYDITRHLLKIMTQGSHERYGHAKISGGVATTATLALLQDIKDAKLGAEDIGGIDINTDENYGAIQFMYTRRRRYEITVSVFETIGHIALVCNYAYRKKHRLIHFDSSSSFRTDNHPIFSHAKAYWTSVSYTYVDYQLCDNWKISNFPPGVCALFTGINAVQSIVGYKREPATFDEFWELFLRVVDATDQKWRNRVITDALRNIWYAATYYPEQFDCTAIRISNIFPPDEYLRFPDVLRLSHADWLKNADFTADCVMLRYFTDIGVGFDRVTEVGYICRKLLHDVTQQGFVNARLTIGASLSRCQACQRVGATHVCVKCKGVYCSANCLSQGH